MKKLAQHLKDKGAPAEEVADFQKKAQGFAKKIVGKFKDYEFYTGESMDVDGM